MRVLERATIGEIGGDAGEAESVTADVRRDAGDGTPSRITRQTSG
jgi:hypothetical protein